MPDNAGSMDGLDTGRHDKGSLGWARRQLERPLVVVGAVVAIGAAVRFAGLDLQSYDHDESVTASLVLQPNFFDMLDVVARLERSPPLYYVLAWLWSKAFGTGEAGLRALSALIGTATVAAAYWSGLQFGLRARAGLAAAALVALSPYLVWYSQEARAYALVVLWEVIALGLFARWQRRPTLGAGLAWAGASALALATQYFAVFLIAPQALLAVIRLRPRIRAAIPISAVAAVGLALVPLAMAQQGGGRTDGFANQGLADRAGTSLLDFFAGEDPPFPTGGDRPIVLLITAAVVAGLVLGWTLLRSTRTRDPNTRKAALDAGLVAAASFGLPLLLAIAGLDFFKYHNLIGTVAPLLLAIAFVLSAPAAGRKSAGVLALLLVFSGVVLGAVQLDRDLQRPDWRGVAQAIGTAPQERLVFGSAVAGTPLRYYLQQGTEITPGARAQCVHVGQIIVITDRPGPTPFDHRRYSLVDERTLVEPFTFYRLKPLQPCTYPADFAGFVRDQGYALLVPPGGPAPRE